MTPKNNPSDEGNKPRSIEKLQRQITDEHYDHVRLLKNRGEYLYFTIKAGERDEKYLTREPRQAGEPFMQLRKRQSG